MMKKFIIILFAFVAVAGATFAYAQVGAGNASLGLKKDLTGLFILTVKDPDGIQEFWLTPPGKTRYGGQVNCPRTFVNNTVVLDAPADFTPTLGAYIVDCQGNREDFTVASPVNGVTFGVSAASAQKAKTVPAPVAPATPLPAQSAGGGGGASAAPSAAPEETVASAKYPIAELGNCANANECRAYCDEPANMSACVTYAEAHNIISAEKAERGKKFLAASAKGTNPGSCATPDSCASYCEDIAHIDECLAFAEDNDFIPAEELVDARRAAKAKRDGLAFPGGCTSKTSCEQYCGDAAHGEECLAFAEKSGMLLPEKLAEARKMMEFLRRGETPGGCNSEASCNVYCEGEGHFDECIAFAEKAGFVNPEEARAVRAAGGKGPGGCKSKTQCEAFCNDPAHVDECIDFGVKAGFVKPEEAEAVRKAGGKGPGNCRSKESCETYCADPAHTEECLDFAMRAGLVKPEEADIVRKAGGKLPGGCRGFAECQAYCMDPAHQSECASLVESAGIKIPEGAGMPGGFGEAGRAEMFQGERERHVRVEASEDPKIVACFKERAGEEFFVRQREGRLAGKDEALKAEDMLRGCGAIFVPRWIEILKEAQSARPADYACAVSKLGQGVVDRILAGEEVSGSSWVVENECRFLQAPGGFAPQAVMPDIPVSIPVTGAGAPDTQAIQKQIEEQYRAQIPVAPPGYEAEFERQRKLIEEQYRQQYQQQYQQQY